TFCKWLSALGFRPSDFFRISTFGFRTSRDPAPIMPASPPITVLIRTFNSGKTLDQVMAALPLAEGDEFLVVDSGSTDETLAIASRHGARVIQPEGAVNSTKSPNLGFSSS